MVGEVGTNAREVDESLDTNGGKIGFRANARVEKNVGRSNNTTRENNFTLGCDSLNGRGYTKVSTRTQIKKKESRAQELCLNSTPLKAGFAAVPPVLRTLDTCALITTCKLGRLRY